MKCSVETRDQFIGLLCSEKNMVKSFSCEFGQKLLDSTKNSAKDALKTALNMQIQKGVEAIDDLIRNSNAGKTRKVALKTFCETQANGWCPHK